MAPVFLRAHQFNYSYEELLCLVLQINKKQNRRSIKAKIVPLAAITLSEWYGFFVDCPYFISYFEGLRKERRYIVVLFFFILIRYQMPDLCQKD